MKQNQLWNSLLGCVLFALWVFQPVSSTFHAPAFVQVFLDDSVSWTETPCVTTTLDGNGSSEFPDDLFSFDQRKNGAIILHFIAAFYCFGMIAIICSEYFLPSVDCICGDLNLSQDVAGATFMALATSIPEFFIALIGTFITMTDIGLGAVVGSGMFNILGVATCGGLAAPVSIQLSWWPLYRDGVTYMIAVAALVGVVWDEYVDVVESVGLLLVYIVYFVIILFNSRLLQLTKSALRYVRRWLPSAASPPTPAVPVLALNSPPTIEITDMDAMDLRIFTDGRESVSGLSKVTDIDNDLTESGPYKPHFLDMRRSSRRSSRNSSSTESNPSKSLTIGRLSGLSGLSANSSQIAELFPNAVLDANSRKSSRTSRLTIAVIEISVDNNKEVKVGVESVAQISQTEEEEDEEEFTGIHLFQIPDGSSFEVIFWVIMLPASILFYFTVPDCRVQKWRRFYPMTFVMCVVWIGVVSYMATWMIVVIGDTIGIPDSVMGLTFLAAGGSMPEAVSSVIVARQGSGGIGFSNSIGCNTLDICLCLAIPWLIKCLITGSSVRIESMGIKYNCIALIVGMFALVFITTLNKFQLNRRLGLICFVCYSLFIIISILVEVGIISGPQDCSS